MTSRALGGLVDSMTSAADTLGYDPCLVGGSQLLSVKAVGHMAPSARFAFPVRGMGNHPSLLCFFVEQPAAYTYGSLGSALCLAATAWVLATYNYFAEFRVPPVRKLPRTVHCPRELTHNLPPRCL